ncbi:MAG: GNAT family N-acetyltransferase [Lachnospiraceae bacterium]|nr:GNAT family N-acetyltransferase [Lachnospiraceae bacterium]
MIEERKPINNGFWPDEIKKYISCKRLAYSEIDNTLFLLYDEKKYRQLVVVGILNTEDFDKVKLPNDIPIVCQVVEKRESSDQKVLRDFLENIGFKCRERIYEYSLNDIGHIKLENPLSEISIRRKVNNEKDYYRILELWKHNLPFIEIPYISIEDLKKMEDDNHLLILDDVESGQIAGACYFDIYLGTSTIHHIVVDSSYRKCGYGTIILKEWIKELKNLGIKRARSWVEESNIASRKSFEKVDFYMTPNVSYQYIL